MRFSYLDLGGVALMEGDNNLADSKTIVNRLKVRSPEDTKRVIDKALFCMENTGLYFNFLTSILKKFKANII